MKFLDACAPYRDAEGAMTLVKDPPKDSCDNLLLFTATMTVIAHLKGEIGAAEWDDFDRLVLSHEIQGGSYRRHLGESFPSSWDDHFGVACASAICGFKHLAEDVLTYGTMNDWTWSGNWLGRIPAFEPTVKAAVGIPLSIGSEIQMAGVFLANCFEKKSETSGKCLLFLAWLVHRKNAGPILTLAMVIWRARIELTYGGMGGVYAIYFGMTHPFTLYPPEFPGT